MLEGLSYAPMLHARLAELRALEELPNSTKNLILPVIKTRPWLNSKSLDKLFERIDRALSGGRFGFDLDYTRCLPSDNRQSYQEFVALFDADGGFSAYYNKVREIENAIPVLRKHNGVWEQIENQLLYVNELERGLFVHVEFGVQSNFEEVAQKLTDDKTENVVFYIDCGWSNDLLGRSAWAVGAIENILAYNEEFELVVSGSSFPDSFVKLGTRFQIPVKERFLFNEVRRNLNRGFIYYGDWGSTRPPVDPAPMKNVPRIDIPVDGHWLSWRSDGDESYEDIAERGMQDREWNGSLGIWGEYLIECTAEGLLPSIRSPATAAAVRVNMHLHYQANFESPDSLTVLDEPIDDDF